MLRKLDVYLSQTPVGELSQDKSGQMWFQYGEAWCESDDAFAISQSLPLQPEPFRQTECRGFFGGLLPEENNRALIARILQISERNDFSMLEKIGGECAGALSFLPSGETPQVDDNDYRAISSGELLDLLKSLPKRPLIAGERGVRLSLAGAQDKLAIRVNQDGQFLLPLQLAPSSHILKPETGSWDGIVANEYYCMMLAKEAGLDTAETTKGEIKDTDYFLSRRFDRTELDGEITRLHQEDFCQALGIASDRKYQAEGGPGLRDCFELLRRVSARAANDLLKLIDTTIFNLLIGNNDAHAKNFSLLYKPEGLRLAPAYDLVSTRYYPELENSLAMTIGRKKNPDLIAGAEIEMLARDCGLGPAATRQRAIAMTERVLAAINALAPEGEVELAIAEATTERCNSLLRRLRR